MLSNWILIFILSIPLIALTAQRTHFLMALLCLESAILILLGVFFFSLNPIYLINSYMMVAILTFGASEASLGLALLVSITRSYGSDSVSALSLIKC